MASGQLQQPPHYTVPISTSAAHSTAITAYPQPANPHLQSPTKTHLGESLATLGKRLDHATRKAGSLAENLYTHLRTGGPDAALSRLAHSTRVLAEGGCDKVFRQAFPDAALTGEKLRAAYACYLSTTAGPVMGTLYISTRRVAFSSDQPLRVASSGGTSGGYCYTSGEAWCYYKVAVVLEDLEAVNASANRRNPAEKYVQLVARDGHEFWFMGFIFYDKALKDLRKALQQRWSAPGAGGAAW